MAAGAVRLPGTTGTTGTAGTTGTTAATRPQATADGPGRGRTARTGAATVTVLVTYGRTRTWR